MNEHSDSVMGEAAGAANKQHFAMRLTVSLTTIIAILSSCSTISKRQSYTYPLPPNAAIDFTSRDLVQIDRQLELAHLADPKNDPLRLLVRYQQARLWGEKDPAKSCALWQDVLAEPQFPLAAIARLRALNVCPTVQQNGVNLDIDAMMAARPEPWMKALLIDSMLSRAKMTNQKFWEMKLSVQEADIAKIQKDQLKLLTRAKELALELKDSETERLAKQKIEQVAPRHIENPKPEELLTVAADFKQAREFDRARETYAKVVSSETLSSLDKLRALDGIRLSFKLEKKIEAYIDATKTYSNFAEKEFLRRGLLLDKRFETSEQGRALLNKYFETRLSLARAVWTEGASAEAEKILRQSEDDVRGAIPTYNAVYVRAAIEEEAGHFEKTVDLLKKIDMTQVVGHDIRAKILWLRAWNLRKLGRLKEAAGAFQQIVDQDETASRARFWLARTEKDLGLSSQATAQFEKIISTDPMSWYALLSYRELGRELPALSSPPAATTESAFMPEEKLTLEWLLAAGESELARNFLDQIANDRKASYSEEQTLDLLRAYARAGHYQALFTRLAEFAPEHRALIFEKAPSLFFPQPYAPIVQAASVKSTVETEFIYAIMRQESSFNPLARSGADAFGLMQLIPEMAKRAEATAGFKIESHEDLYNPEINIQLGASFLKDLFQIWHGRFLPTVASYNASEKAISGWMKSRYRGDVLTFIEDVPYEETRTYLKLVMRNYIFYKRLNSRVAGQPAPAAFPEWCLANLQDAKP